MSRFNDEDNNPADPEQAGWERWQDRSLEDSIALIEEFAPKEDNDEEVN